MAARSNRWPHQRQPEVRRGQFFPVPQEAAAQPTYNRQAVRLQTHKRPSVKTDVRKALFTPAPQEAAVVTPEPLARFLKGTRQAAPTRVGRAEFFEIPAPRIKALPPAFRPTYRKSPYRTRSVKAVFWPVNDEVINNPPQPPGEAIAYLFDDIVGLGSQGWYAIGA